MMTPCAVVVGWKILLLIFISPYIIVAFELQKLQSGGFLTNIHPSGPLHCDRLYFIHHGWS